MALVTKPDLVSDLRDAKLGIAQQLLGALQSALINVIVRRYTGCLLKPAGKMVGAFTNRVGDAAQRQLVTQVRADGLER